MQTNGYVIFNDKKEAIIIDPGDIGRKVLNYCQENELVVQAILLTHGHFDHIGAVDYLYNHYGCDIYIHEEDIQLLHDASLNLSAFQIPFTISAPVKSAPQVLQIADFKIEWMHLPGHCPGSSMLYFVEEKVIFSGDVLFQGSIGRFDFPLSSKHDTLQSLQKIRELAFDAELYPGHGESSTLAIEKQSNPYLKT